MRSAHARRAGERGSAVVAVLILLSAALLVAVGARHFGGAAVDQLSCQGDAVRAIGSGSSAGCGGGAAERSMLGRSPAASPPGSEGPTRPRPRPAARAGLVESDSAGTLAPLFDIVESITGRAAENQLTEKGFDEVVDLYDDVREGRTGVRFTRRATPYLDVIMADIARILQTRGGRMLIDALAHADQPTAVSVSYVRNADGVEDPALGLDASNAFAEYDGRSGKVTYAPGERVVLPGVDLELNPWADWRADVALYHELVHVLDYIRDTGDPRIAEEAGVEFSAMEYQAVGIGPWLDARISENAYRAARRAIAALGIGAADGDADMPDRPRYIPIVPPADPPGPAPER